MSEDAPELDMSLPAVEGRRSQPSSSAGDPAKSLTAWYCAKTKPKHEHVAAANIRATLGLEVFSPRLQSQQTTIHGVVKRITEPVFPGYIFVHCALHVHLDQVRYTSGISNLVHFGGRIPSVPEGVIADLRNCFGVEDVMELEREPAPGDGVTLAGGAFLGLEAVVLRTLPAKRRVEVLLEILGRPTPIEVDRNSLTLHKSSVAEYLPMLAAVSFA